MSVLYKALAQAAKANRALKAASGGPPNLVARPEPGPPRRPLRFAMRALLVFMMVSMLGMGVGLLMLDEDTMQEMVAEGMGEDVQRPPAARRPSQAAQAPRPAAPRPPQPVAVAPPAPPQPLDPGMSTEAQQPPAPPPLPAQAQVQAPALPPPAPPPQQVAQAPQPVQQPQAPQQQQQQQQQPVQQQPVQQQQAVQQQAAPPAGGTGIDPTAPEGSRVTNLAAVLENIRRQKTSSVLKGPVEVMRAAVPGGAGQGLPQGQGGAVADMVSVRLAQPAAREEMEVAYQTLVRGDYEAAANLYGGLVDRDQRSVPALLGRAAALHKLRRLDEARSLYEHALAIEPDNREALTNVLSLISMDAPVEALGYLRELQRANPSFSPIPAQMAQIHARTGDLQQAVAAMHVAVRLAPENALYRLNLAILQDRAGLAREAAEAYEAALAAADQGTWTMPIPRDQVRQRLTYLKAR